MVFEAPVKMDSCFCFKMEYSSKVHLVYVPNNITGLIAKSLIIERLGMVKNFSFDLKLTDLNTKEEYNDNSIIKMGVYISVKRYPCDVNNCVTQRLHYVKDSVKAIIEASKVLPTSELDDFEIKDGVISEDDAVQRSMKRKRVSFSEDIFDLTEKNRTLTAKLEEVNKKVDDLEKFNREIVGESYKYRMEAIHTKSRLIESEANYHRVSTYILKFGRKAVNNSTLEFGYMAEEIRQLKKEVLDLRQVISDLKEIMKDNDLDLEDLMG